MDNIILPILVCLLVGSSIGFLIAKAMEKSREKKLLNGTRKEAATILKEAKIDAPIVKKDTQETELKKTSKTIEKKIVEKKSAAV